MNLHGIVRTAINTVNPDITGLWRESTGFTQDASGRALPAYANHSGTRMQVQALTGKDLMHEAFMSMQGVKRSVYAFGNIQGVRRPDGTGGDLLVFPQNRGGQDRVWLVVAVLETWTPDSAGWCKVGVVLQPDVLSVDVPPAIPEVAPQDIGPGLHFSWSEATFASQNVLGYEIYRTDAQTLQDQSNFNPLPDYADLTLLDTVGVVSAYEDPTATDWLSRQYAYYVRALGSDAGQLDSNIAISQAPS